MGKGAQSQNQPQQLQHSNPILSTAKLMFCTETSHGKCYSGFDYDGDMGWKYAEYHLGKCKGKKSLSSQTSKIFKVLLIHIWTTSPLPPKPVPQVVKGISRVTKGGVSRSRIIWKLQSKLNCLDLVFVPEKSCLLLLSTEPSCLGNAESAHSYRERGKEGERNKAAPYFTVRGFCSSLANSMDLQTCAREQQRSLPAGEQDCCSPL